MEKTIKLGKRIYFDNFEISILVPFHGTPIYEELKEKGMLNTENWEQYAYGGFRHVNLIERMGLKPDELIKIYVKSYILLYFNALFKK